VPGAGALRVVLVEPQYAGNIGQCARAMLNTGFRDLVLVQPREALTDEAFWMARDAGPILQRARICASLPDALEGASLAVGTTRRTGKYRRPALSAREAAARLMPLLPENDVAIVFGREDNGLSSEQLDLCQWIVTIPASEEFASYNLAQAVLLCLYEVFVMSASGEGQGGAAGEGEVRSRLAGPERLERFYEHLHRTLTETRFLVGDQAPWIFRTLRRLFGRADPEPRDLKILHGVLAQMEWYRDRGLAGARKGLPDGARLLRATPADRDSLFRLLEQGALPWTSLDPARHSVFIVRAAAESEPALGCVAIELYGADALLRSLAVAGSARGHGLGRRLTEEALMEAARLGARQVWLLTTTAQEFFARAGFEASERAAAPVSLHGSEQWEGCRAGAVLMRRSVPV